MGIFGGLFEKKECSICGGEIGMLGNRKLEDGNMCKNCAGKLSPLFSDRKNSTVDEIKQQLLYREENEKKLQSFNPTVVIGHDTKVYIDIQQKKFIVTRASNWRGNNPDLIDFSQVISCELHIDESKNELYDKDNEGNRIRYNPPRYEYSYAFHIEINVNSPYFDEIEFELSDENPDSPYTELYRQYEQEAHELQNILMQKGAAMPMGGNMGHFQATAPKQTSNVWICTECGTQNTGKFCQNCGKPSAPSYQCDKCGWVPADKNNIPKFCPNCGDVFNSEDRN